MNLIEELGRITQALPDPLGLRQALTTSKPAPVMVAAPAEPPTVPDLLPIFLESRRTRRQVERHVEHQEQILRHVERETGKLLAAIDRADLDRYMAALARRPDLAAATIRKYQCTIRQFYEWALDEEHETAAKRVKFSAPRLPKRLPVHLEADEIARLMAAVEGTPYHQARVRVAFALCLYAGLRASEATGLDWGAVSRESSTLTVIGKGNKQRRVFVSDALWSYLDAWQQACGRTSGPVLLDQWTPPNRLNYDQLRGEMNKATRNGKMSRQRFTLHKLRHTYATQLRRAGIELDVIQVQMGHEDISTTTIYAHVNVDDATTARINAALAGNSSPPNPATSEQGSHS